MEKDREREGDKNVSASTRLNLKNLIPYKKRMCEAGAGWILANLDTEIWKWPAEHCEGESRVRFRRKALTHGERTVAVPTKSSESERCLSLFMSLFW